MVSEPLEKGLTLDGLCLKCDFSFATDTCILLTNNVTTTTTKSAFTLLLPSLLPYLRQDSSRGVQSAEDGLKMGSGVRTGQDGVSDGLVYLQDCI